MKQLRHVLALTLVFCMVFGMVTPSLAVSGEISVEEDYGIPVEEDGGIEIEVDDRSDYDIDEDREELSVLPKQDETADETNADSGNEYKYNIIHLDCGRKYFSVDSIKQIIDNASAAGFNYIQLAVGNDGMRFLLDDMSLTVNGTTYDSNAVSTAIHAGNEAYNKTFTEWTEYKDGSYYTTHLTYTTDVNELTQSEMDAIIAYAYTKGMGVIPLINTPGHMDAILDAAEALTGKTCSYNGSVRTIDVTNTTAVAFTEAFLNKYITYFAGKGCTLFNMGADEYANDIYLKYTGMGFGKLQDANQYNYFASYVNKIAGNIKSAGMKPMAFNDGIYFGSVESTTPEFDKDIIIEYWSSGWPGYTPRSASGLAAKGFKMVNTHGDYYWVLGKPDAQCSATKASGFDKNVFPGSNITDPDGSTFCIWSDYPGDDTEKNVVKNTTATISAFGGTLPTVDSVTNGGTTDPAGETVTVTVGGTFTVTQDGVNNENNVDRRELDESIATVVVTGTDAVESKDTYTAKSVKASDLATKRRQWVETKYYCKVNGNYEKLYAKYTGSLMFGYTYSFAYKVGNNYKTAYNSTDNGDSLIDVYEKSTTDPVPASTTITITGKTVGTTYITVGGVRYTINVVAENLDGVTPITVEYWITNGPVTGSDNATSKKIAANTVYGEAGYKFADLVPANGRRATNDEVVFWKGTRLTSDNKQTATDGVDKTRSGDDFTYIRYWDKKWSFSADGVNWKDFNSDDQIVAYYLQKTNVTDEINTEVVDWGVIPHTDYTNSYSDYVLLDYAVRYQSGDRSPNSFPVNGKTQAFHCNSDDTTTVHYKNGEYYRQIGMVRAKQTSDYEVYMITLTPTSSTPSTYISSTTSYEYDYSSEEKVIWVDDADNLGDFADSSKWFESISHAYDFSLDTSVGGDPIVPGLEIYNRHGMLVTYYIRVNEPETSLTVHYVDDTINNEFYSYNIAVKGTTTFAENIGIDNPNADKPKIINNTVTNAVGKTETVNSDLKSMPQLSSYYRFSDFKLVRVVRSNDGKEVWLYYTFNNRHDFVVDFGVPLHLDPADIGLDSSTGAKWDTATLTTGNKILYGTAEIATGKGLTYTPTKVMSDVETIAVDLSDSSNPNDDPATHFIYLYPATNVLYEENVITNPADSGWTTTGTSTITATTTQATEKLGEENLHGYDDVYDEVSNTEFSGGSAYMAELTLPAGQRNVRTNDELSFTFTGTGFDLISECGTNTGALLVKVYRVDSQGNKTLEHGFLVDTYFSGDATFITGKDILDYQVPVVRDFIKKTENDESVNDYGTYEVTVKGFLFSNSGAAVNSTNAISTYSTQNVVEETLASLGIPEEDFDLYEVVYMDDNSVLNGGTGAETSVVKSSDVAEFVTDIAMGNAFELNDATDGSKTAYVYVDGIRVYNTIEPEKQPGYKTSEKNTEYYNVYDFALNSSAGVSDKWDNNSLIYVEKDGNKNLFTIADYKKQGPENEIYLTSGNAVAFVLDGYSKHNSTVHISAKAVSGAPMFNGQEVLTNTEMYYDVSELVSDDEKYGKYIVLKNDAVNDSVLSISGIKVSSNIELIANADFGEFIAKELTPAQGDEFKPETFKASIPKSVKKNRKFSISASASADVQEVVVKDSDGNVIISKTQDKANNSSSPYRYSLLVTAPNISGNYSVKVYAKDVNGKFSAPIELTITVK